MSGYLDNSGREDVLSGGSRMIAVDTPYRVWVKRTGNNPSLRVLLLHGGPGATHEYLEAQPPGLIPAGMALRSARFMLRERPAAGRRMVTAVRR
jgi:proline iminopeptidase